MATHWVNNTLKVELLYWIKKDGRKDLIGTIKFDLECKPIAFNVPRIGPNQIAMILKRSCGHLIRMLSFKHKMFDAEMIDLLSNVFYEYYVDPDSIEIDNKRILKEFSKSKGEV